MLLCNCPHLKKNNYKISSPLITNWCLCIWKAGQFRQRVIDQAQYKVQYIKTSPSTRSSEEEQDDEEVRRNALSFFFYLLFYFLHFSHFKGSSKRLILKYRKENNWILEYLHKLIQDYVLWCIACKKHFKTMALFKKKLNLNLDLPSIEIPPDALE